MRYYLTLATVAVCFLTWIVREPVVDVTYRVIFGTPHVVVFADE